MLTKRKAASLKRRKNRAKAKRLETAKLKAQVRQALKALKADVHVVALKHPSEVVFGIRTGLLGHPTTTVLRVPHEKIVGGVEDNQELGEVVTQLGLLALGGLLRFNLAMGPEELAKAFAKWAGIDLEALKKEAEQEAAKTTEEVDEDGDVVVRSVEEPALSEALPYKGGPDQVEEPETPAVENAQ
jgi:hypothetical protein